MNRLFWVFLVAALSATSWMGQVSAQEAQVDSAFSDEIITTLGYPEIAITVGPEGSGREEGTRPIDCT